MLPARSKSPDAAPQTAPRNGSDRSARWKLLRPAAKAPRQVRSPELVERRSGPLFSSLCISFLPRTGKSSRAPSENRSLALGRADFVKQIRQCSHAPAPHVRKLPLVKFAHSRVEALQQFQPAACNSRFHHAPIVTLALPRNQVALFHTVQQACYVRIVRNHALGDAAARQPLRLRAAQDTQHIVLRAGKAVGL